MTRKRAPPADLPPVAVRRLVAVAQRGRTRGAVLRLDGPKRARGRALRHGVVLPTEGEARARAWLVAGAQRVYVGEAALRDSTLIERLVCEFGTERIGVHAPARRMSVYWSMDPVSNADFKVMTPSIGEPAWEILLADGSPSGTHAAWWIEEMFRLGAASAIVRVDIEDDADLNILAKLAESCGERLWFGPREQAEPDIEPWIRLAHVRQIVVPDRLYREHPYLVACGGAVARPGAAGASA